MALSIGIIGLPNVGKSTVFNALTQTQQAHAANYPFCTIEPNRALVPVPDDRIDRLGALVKQPNVIHATIEFVDIAGLVKGASRGEGLGNQFLHHIREADALVHVVRCFEDENVVHVSPTLDPISDIEVVNTELALSDLERLERRIERLTREVKGDRHLLPALECAQALLPHLAQGLAAATFDRRDTEAFRLLDHEMRFITNKPVIFAANVGEGDLAGGNAQTAAVRAYADTHDADLILLCAELEAEMAGLTVAERQEFLAASGATDSGLTQVIRQSFHILGLISFFTIGDNEVRAWEVPAGTPAPRAAGKIHTDFERGFIAAEVVPFPVLVSHGSEANARHAGVTRLEGKTYPVQDGDVIRFRFNV